MNNKKRLSRTEIQIYILNILRFFDGFCKKNNLNYMLAGGTLLGAIRHKGFIPWDDDIDVCMPRPDYEKMLEIFRNDNNRYCIVSKKNNDEYCLPLAKILDKKTYVENGQSVLEKNLWIDILPVDGLPTQRNEIKKIYRICYVYRLMFGLVNATKFPNCNPIKKYVKIILRLFIKLYGKVRITKKIDDYAQRYSYEKSENVGIITWGIYGENECMKKKEFEKIIHIDFEGDKYPIFSCWNSYLTNLYGDYMKLPPIEKRINHDIDVYYVDGLYGDEM